MTTQNTEYFELLKEAIVSTLKESHPEVSDTIGEWKGHTISIFQEDLLDKVNDQVSEKWFYTHMKTSKGKLPRVDILNLLSKYVGYRDWQDFVHQSTVEVITHTPVSSRPNRVFLVVPGIMLIIVGGIFGVYKLLSARDYQFCFVGFDTPSIGLSEVQIEVLHDDESPILLQGDDNGCVTIQRHAIKVRFVVRSPYYKTDTITRLVNKFSDSEIVKLESDNYAMMLHYFSTNDSGDWNKRRDQLNEMIADSARIYEVFSSGTTGLELYNKREFIDKLSVPSRSLNQIKVLNTRYENERIVSLRFTQTRH